MLLLASVTDVLSLVTSAAVNTIEVHASYTDKNGAVYTPGRKNTVISVAATTTIVASPAASTVRNVRGLYINNNSASGSTSVAVVHTDGTTAVELLQVILLPGENLTFSEDGGWRHRDANGADYPPAGLGAYAGRSVPFMKSSTGSDAVGYWYCTSKDAGFPGAWAPGTPGVNGRVTDGTSAADAGCLPIANPVTGSNYLTALELATSVAHTNDFFDVLWVNSGLVITTTTAQAIASPVLPARDVNGSTNGEGCMIALLCTGAVGLAAVASNATVNYTNSAGVAGRTATLSAIVGSQAPATPVIGTLIWFDFQAGDKGVRSIQGITLNTSWVSGTISLMITRDIGTIGTPTPNVSSPKQIANPGIRLYNNSCILHCILSSATTATFFSGSLNVTER